MGVSSDYKFVIADLLNNELDEIPANNPSWGFKLNDSGACSLSLPNRDPKCTRALLPVLGCELRIYRGTSRVWGGHLYSAEPTGEGDVQFIFNDYLYRLKRRYVDTSQNFNSAEQLNIAWNLINFTQTKTNGNLGMGWTRFSATGSGINRDINYPFWERANIFDAIQALAVLNNGFDFEVTPNKEWKTYFPSKGTSITIPLEYGKNVDGISLMEDGSDTANAFSAIGAGDGKNTCIAVATDATSQTTYGLLESSESDTSVKHYSLLQDRAIEGLRMLKNPRKTPNLSLVSGTEPLPFSYSVGDRINLYANEGYLVVNQVFRIISVDIQLDNEGREAITLGFDDKVDI